MNDRWHYLNGLMNIETQNFQHMLIWKMIFFRKTGSKLMSILIYFVELFVLELESHTCVYLWNRLIEARIDSVGDIAKRMRRCLLIDQNKSRTISNQFRKITSMGFTCKCTASSLNQCLHVYTQFTFCSKWRERKRMNGKCWNFHESHNSVIFHTFFKKASPSIPSSLSSKLIRFTKNSLTISLKCLIFFQIDQNVRKKRWATLSLFL